MLGNVFVQASHNVVAAQQQGGGNPLVSLLLPLVLFGLVFYFLLIRPQRTRQRKTQEMQSSLAPGQRVMTIAGLHATVSAIEDDVVVLEVAPGVECRYAKQAVNQVVDSGESAADDSADDSADSADEGETPAERDETGSGKAADADADAGTDGDSAANAGKSARKKAGKKAADAGKPSSSAEGNSSA